MNQIITVKLDERTVQALKKRAWERGLPFEEALRRLLTDGAKPPEHKAARMPAFAA